MKRVIGLCIICVYILGLGNIVLADEHENIVHARIGIELYPSGEENRYAKAFDDVKAGDRLRIYVQPDPDPAYIYVIYSDQKIVAWLNKEEQEILENRVLSLPGEKEFYIVDGKSPLEQITIICSPERLTKLEEFLNAQNPSYEKWVEYEQEVTERSHIDLSEKIPKPINIAGTMRSLFPEELRIFSGKSFVVKKFEFRVKTK